MSGKDRLRATRRLPLSRRELLRRGGAIGLVAFGPLGCGEGGRIGVPTRDAGSPPDGGFLDAQELRTLGAACDVFVPADTDPGAVAAGCAGAINGLLSAFAFDPPLIYAGGPFSDRGGAVENDFLDFVPLDPYEELAWRLKIEGSQGRPEREFNGPRTGWQQIYREGLAALDARAGGDFAALPAPARELILREGQGAIGALVDVAFLQTLDAMYGAPEYGGNRDLVGWGFTGYDGDVQPRGYSDEQVENPDNPGVFDLLPGGTLPAAPLLPLPDAAQRTQIHAALREMVGMASAEFALGIMLGSNSSLAQLRADCARLRPREA